MSHNLIALTGYARAGKDSAAKSLIDIGYQRVAFGDIIKRKADKLIQQELGFSAFTEDDEQKRLIRPLLETVGDVFYDNILKEFFDQLPDRAVNTRLVRQREAEAWVGRGGIIIEIRRPGYGPATSWERDRLHELRELGLIRYMIEESDKLKLQQRVLELAA